MSMEHGVQQMACTRCAGLGSIAKRQAVPIEALLLRLAAITSLSGGYVTFTLQRQIDTREDHREGWPHWCIDRSY
jgi:hypothetical protein